MNSNIKAILIVSFLEKKQSKNNFIPYHTIPSYLIKKTINSR
mgnify:CR=1 FL=1